jgi:hypothetical protein
MHQVNLEQVINLQFHLHKAITVGQVQVPLYQVVLVAVEVLVVLVVMEHHQESGVQVVLDVRCQHMLLL